MLNNDPGWVSTLALRTSLVVGQRRPQGGHHFLARSVVQIGLYVQVDVCVREMKVKPPVCMNRSCRNCFMILRGRSVTNRYASSLRAKLLREYYQMYRSPERLDHGSMLLARAVSRPVPASWIESDCNRPPEGLLPGLRRERIAGHGCWLAVRWRQRRDGRPRPARQRGRSRGIA